MGNRQPTISHHEPEHAAPGILNAGVSAVVRAASRGRSPWPVDEHGHADEAMIINFSRLVHITHATALAGSSPR